MQNTDLAQKYQSKTARQHCLDAPDTYIGSTEAEEQETWCFDGKKMTYKKHNIVQGLFKIFDEAAVNARDHSIRLESKINEKEKNIIPVSSIQFNIDKESGEITIYNDGNGIDIAQHPETKLWIPEMIFGHLRTSTNYNKEEKKIVGGKNGFGIKLVFIYSLKASIETVDHTRGKKYCQEFKDNLSVIGKPSIRKCEKSKPYTKVTFLPDYKRFGMDNLTDDMYNLLVKRCYDIAAVTSKKVKVKLNKELIPVRTFEQYIDLYIGNKSEKKRLHEIANDRWEFAVTVSPLGEFSQVSFVNGIHTRKGGKHVEYLLNQIVKKLVTFIEKKKKVKVKPVTIKEQLMLFVKADIENPSFDSQTKEYLATPASKFGSSCTVSNKLIEKLAKMGIMDSAIALTEIKDNKAAKKTDGKKQKLFEEYQNY